MVIRGHSKIVVEILSTCCVTTLNIICVRTDITSNQCCVQCLCNERRFSSTATICGISRYEIARLHAVGSPGNWTCSIIVYEVWTIHFRFKVTKVSLNIHHVFCTRCSIKGIRCRNRFSVEGVSAHCKRLITDVGSSHVSVHVDPKFNILTSGLSEIVSVVENSNEFLEEETSKHHVVVGNQIGCELHHCDAAWSVNVVKSECLERNSHIVWRIRSKHNLERVFTQNLRVVWACVGQQTGCAGAVGLWHVDKESRPGVPNVLW